MTVSVDRVLAELRRDQSLWSSDPERLVALAVPVVLRLVRADVETLKERKWDGSAARGWALDEVLALLDEEAG